MQMSVEACANFGESMSALAEGMRGMPDKAFYRQTFAQAAKIIEWLLGQLPVESYQQGELEATHRETKEGEKEKRDISPTPPIESKAKEEAKKETTCLLTRARGSVLAINREADAVFDAFWSKYPSGHLNNKKECRKKIRAKYKTAYDTGKSAEFVNAFFEGLDRWLKSDRWARGYVVHPTTFINQERWREFPEESIEETYEQKAEAEQKVKDDCDETLKRLGL